MFNRRRAAGSRIWFGLANSEAAQRGVASTTLLHDDAGAVGDRAGCRIPATARSCSCGSSASPWRAAR